MPGHRRRSHSNKGTPKPGDESLEGAAFTHPNVYEKDTADLHRAFMYLPAGFNRLNLLSDGNLRCFPQLAQFLLIHQDGPLKGERRLDVDGQEVLTQALRDCPHLQLISADRAVLGSNGTSPLLKQENWRLADPLTRNSLLSSCCQQCSNLAATVSSLKMELFRTESSYEAQLRSLLESEKRLMQQQAVLTERLLNMEAMISQRQISFGTSDQNGELVVGKGAEVQDPCDSTPPALSVKGETALDSCNQSHCSSFSDVEVVHQQEVPATGRGEPQDDVMSVCSSFASSTSNGVNAPAAESTENVTTHRTSPNKEESLDDFCVV